VRREQPAQPSTVEGEDLNTVVVRHGASPRSYIGRRRLMRTVTRYLLVATLAKV
jgi:hypothetical protein